MNDHSNNLDLLNMKHYRMEKLQNKEKSRIEKLIALSGGPLAIMAFIIIMFFIKFPFLQNIDPSILGKASRSIFDQVGSITFTKMNIAMLAVFTASIILWITEAVPNYLTSLILIIALVLTGVLPEEVAYAQLGHKVMWLNILS
ncbi:MAG: sodium:sulfate symporter, partial [Candidatus Aminicenantes bacterium]|nr:sodium:sulfate symporter [Candidatus Aminicenantes bacterium]